MENILHPFQKAPGINKGYYSQAGQDKFVAEFFNFKKNGYYLDIGALDGVTSSNTFYLEKELEWKGICFEPQEIHYKLAEQIREKVVRMGVYNKNSLENFNPNLSVIDENYIGINKIPTITFETLIKKFNVPKIIDYISLDIEGQEYNALTKFPFDTHLSILWTIEHAYCIKKDPTLKNNIKEIMLRNNYLIIKEDIGCPDTFGIPFEDCYIHKDYIK